jgi:Secretion system C-terminal sorting domain
MRIFTSFLTLAFIVFFSWTINGQNRYLDPVFNEVTVSNPTPLALNYTILQWLFAPAGPAKRVIKQPLVAQFYSPKGDTETKRPLIIYVHTGNFFPYPDNGSCGGTLRDSSNVEIATRLAKMGYVVAVVNYRQGWNPFDQRELIRRFFLINAAYRGVQDMATYVRYFKRSEAELGNPHGIDASKITIWGQGTGGYLSLASAYLKSYPEIFNTADPLKFFLSPPTTPVNIPMVREKYNGTITGEGPIATVDAEYNSYTTLPIGDTLCAPNHVGFSSDIALCVNMGGALGDSTWLSQGEVPLISFHVDTDPFAPVETDVLNVPTPLGPQPVVEVSGSRDLAERADRLGNNNMFANMVAKYDPMNANNPVNNLGYYEFRGTPNDQSGPWEWAASATTSAGASGCNTNRVTAKIYIDTITAFFAPRACIALNLPCKSIVTSTQDLTDAKVNLKMAPNPATTDIFITVSDETPIKSYAVFDISGRMVRNYNNVNSSVVTLKRESLQNGLYLVKMQFDGGTLTKKVVFE